MEYELIRSSRKTLALQIKDGKLIIRSPLKTSHKTIDAFVGEHREWIERNMKKSLRRQKEAAECGTLSSEEINKLSEKALKMIPQRVEYYAKIIGVTYGRITIRNQLTRWGSCSSKGNLNFNCLLMLTPPEVIDSVVVHELCHRLEMNHSDRFYAHVYRAYPEYDKWNKWLKENGGVLISRMG